VNIPVDKRVRDAIIRARALGRSYEDIAEMVGVGRATVNRILRLHRETGAIEPREPGGGNVSPIQGRVAELLCAIVLETNDATLDEITDLLVARGGIQTSRSAVARAMLRLGFSRKKSLSSPVNGTRRSAASTAKNSARS
jgi:transposase